MVGWAFNGTNIGLDESPTGFLYAPGFVASPTITVELLSIPQSSFTRFYIEQISIFDILLNISFNEHLM